MSLSILQNRFLAKRLTCKSDREAAQQCEPHPISEDVVYKWKRDEPEFLAAYNKLGEDGVELARAILRQHLGEAAAVLSDSLKAKRGREPDHTARIEAAKQILKSHHVITDKHVVAGDRDNPLVVLTADELHEVVERARRGNGDAER